MSTQRKSATQSERDPDMAGAEAAMHRAARRARERAAQTANTTTALPSAKNSGDLPKPETDHGVHSSWLDNGQYSYSQAQGYEAMPGPLKLGELPDDARTGIWNVLFDHISHSVTREFLDALGRRAADSRSMGRDSPREALPIRASACGRLEPGILAHPQGPSSVHRDATVQPGLRSDSVRAPSARVPAQLHRTNERSVYAAQTGLRHRYRTTSDHRSSRNAGGGKTHL